MFCKGCQYPLAQVKSERCPECGRMFAAWDTKSFDATLGVARRRRVLHMVRLIALVALVAGYVGGAVWVMLADSHFPLSGLRAFIPGVLILCLFGATMAILLVRRWRVLAPFAVVAIVLVCWSILTTSRMKQFVKLWQDISPGTSRSAFQASLRERFPPGGEFAPPSVRVIADETLAVVLEPQARFTYIVFVEFRSDVVEDVQFSYTGVDPGWVAAP